MANVAKLEEILKTPETFDALTKLTTREEILAFMNEKGAEMTADELTGLGKAIKKAVENKGENMNLDDMENVAGGGFFTVTYNFIGNLFTIGPDLAADMLVTGVDKVYSLVDAIFDLD